MICTKRHLTACAAAVALVLGVTSVLSEDLRDPAFWPFDSTSPWNTPIGSKARYATPSSSKWQTVALQYGFIMTCADWGRPVSIARNTDPLRSIYRIYDFGPRVEYQMRVSDFAQPAGGSDNHLLLVDETHSYVIEMLLAVRRSDDDLEAPFPNKIDLRGSGVCQQYCGACAYGGPAIAGLIRKDELTNGIRHALCMSLTTAVLNPNGPRWPAVTQEDNYEDPASNMYMGSLLAIPPDVDITTIVGPAGTVNYELARALQDYGAYVIDRGHLNIYCEPQAQAEVNDLNWQTAIMDLPKYLKVVVNSSADSVGGGGTRRRLPAPGLLPENWFSTAVRGNGDVANVKFSRVMRTEAGAYDIRGRWVGQIAPRQFTTTTRSTKVFDASKWRILVCPDRR